MPDKTNQPFNPDFSRGLDIESIISAPLVAASKANAVMVTGQTRFLLEYCFTKGEDNNYAPVMIDMAMTRGIVDEAKNAEDAGYIRQMQLTFSVPLLCLVPINSLAVEKIALDFDMEITSVIPKENETANNSDNLITPKEAQLNGKISYDHGHEGNSGSGRYKSQMANKLKVSLNAGSLPLPVGVLTLIDLYTKAIQPLPIENTTET